MKRYKYFLLAAAAALLLSACSKAEPTAPAVPQQPAAVGSMPKAEKDEAAAAPAVADSDAEGRRDESPTEPEASGDTLPIPAEEPTGSIPASSDEAPEATELRGRTGQFFDIVEEDPFVVFRENGQHYGYEERFLGCCSVWCAVLEHQVSVEASSHLAPQGQFSYEPEHIYNGDRSNAWIEGIPGYGVNEYIKLSYRYTVADAPYGVDFRELCMVNGYAQTKAKWEANSRVKEMKLFFNDEFVDMLLLEDTINPQYFDLSSYGLHAASGEEGVFLFEIVSVYPGTEYEDTALTGIEIDIWTPNH